MRGMRGEGMRTFVIFLCHACGYAVNEEMGDLSCSRCGEPRSMIEEIQVQEVAREA